MTEFKELQPYEYRVREASTFSIDQQKYFFSSPKYIFETYWFIMEFKTLEEANAQLERFERKLRENE